MISHPGGIFSHPVRTAVRRRSASEAPSARRTRRTSNYGASMALYAALAVGACGGCSPFLTQPAIDPVAKDLAVADGFACGLQGGVPYCWGDASFGATGDGSVPRTTLPALAPVDSLVKFVSVSAGGVDFSSDAGHACGLTATGAVYCWGDNRFGQLGQGTTSPSSSTVPLAVAPGTVFRSISAGGTHSCGVTTAGDVLCWGNDSSWQVGVGANPIGTAAVVATPTRPVFAAPQPSFVSVSAGATHTCAITDTGALWCWGNNQDLQLGVPRNPNLSSRRPVAVGGGAQSFKQVSAGTSRTCAIDVTDTAFCWGTGFLGGTSPGSSPIPGVAQVAIP